MKMDTVIDKQSKKTVLMVLSERVTRNELFFRLPSKSQNAVVNELERKMGLLFLQIPYSI